MTVAIVGDRNPSSPTHRQTETALTRARDQLGSDVELVWVPTDSLETLDQCGPYSGFFIAPGSPYANRAGALLAVRAARETGRPALAT